MVYQTPRQGDSERTDRNGESQVNDIAQITEAVTRTLEKVSCAEEVTPLECA
jgi:hypothetical protein